MSGIQGLVPLAIRKLMHPQMYTNSPARTQLADESCTIGVLCRMIPQE